MKFMLMALAAALLVLCLESTVYSQRLGCGYPTVSDNRGTYYMSCFNRLTGETNDTQRIQAAVNYIPGGKLIFDKTPDGTPYTVSEAVALHSNLILEGTSTGATIVPASSVIKLTASGTATTPNSVFKVGQLVSDVVIRDLGLLADNTVTSYTVGILAEGTYHPVNPTSSLNFKFSNIRFTGFTTGIKVNALDTSHSWQFDNVNLEHCTFEACQTGVHINSFNSGWQISGIEFFSQTNALGVYIERGAYTTIDSMIGNLISTQPAKTFIKIKEMAAPITIRNCVSEGFENDLIVEAIGNLRPLTLTANIFQAKVNIRNADVVSMGNSFGLTVRNELGTVVYQAPQPIAGGSTRITSIGDKFCNEGESNCATGGYVTLVNAAAGDYAYVQFSSDVNKNLINRPTYMTNLLNITSDMTLNPAEPLLTLSNPTFNNLPLLRLGTGSFHYTLSRDDNGYLRFVGSQSTPYRGYSFDGPIKLPAYTAATLPAPLGSGELVFCSNCQAGTSPCASGSGGGALAVTIAGNWVCK